MKINRTKTDKRDTQNRQVYVKTVYSLTFQLKSREKSKFVLKRNLSFETSIAPETPTQEVHETARSYYGVKNTNTLLASYTNESWIGKVKNFGEFLSLLNEKKRPPTIYFMYPYPYWRLLLEKEEDNSLNKRKLNLCNVCYNEYTNFCLECAVAEERQGIENQENPINRDEATLSALTSPSSELLYSNSFCNFYSPIEINISNTPLTLTNPPSLPSARSFLPWMKMQTLKKHTVGHH